MKYLSVCSGIEAATSAWHHLGWEPVAFSEIEPFPSAVLQHHYPNVPNWGDMTKYQTWPDATIDLLVGGTPCQSFSVAGLRQGLKDPRGNLMLTFLGIADRYRPRYIVWENVPGVLSSNGGKDFGSFLGALGELGYGWAYRVLDAQWFGVAQRRRRVFVVGCLGDQRRAAEVLFESESVSRNTPPSRAKGQGAAADAQGSLGSRGNKSHTELDGHGAYVPESIAIRTANTKANRHGVATEITHTLDQANGQAVMSAHAFKMRGGCEGGGKGYLGSDDTAFTVATHQDQQIAQPVATFAKSHKPMSVTDAEGWSPVDAAPTVTHWPRDRSDAGTDVAVVYERHDQDARVKEVSVAPTLHSKSDNICDLPMVQAAMQVRRLTPVECERLQGFPIVRQMLYIAVCLDQASGSVDVALRCHRLQSNVWPADASELMQFAATAEGHSSTPQVSQDPLALVRVLMHSEAKVQELHSAGKLIWSVKSAEGQSECRQPTQVETIAHALARHSHVVVKEAIDGKVGSQQSISGSSHQKNGEVCVTLSIAGTKANASDATNDHHGDRPQFTTSELGQVIPKEDSTLATALCSVLHAIAGSIPVQTLPENFSIAIEVGRGYTNIPWRKKAEAPDGPRYKALGNSMAVPVMRWIGERINKQPC